MKKYPTRNFESNICNWCGKPAFGRTGMLIFNDGRNTYGWTCREQEPKDLHRKNPIFESEVAWQLWKKAHPRISEGMNPHFAIIKGLRE